MSKETAKKAFGITAKIFSWIIIAVAVFMMLFTVISSLTFDKNDRDIFGMRFYIVLSDSMSLSENNKNDEVHFNAGDIVIIKNVDDPTALKPGDIIAFISQNTDSYGKTITHKIREVQTNTKGGVLGYVTYGTNTGENDKALVEPDFVLGTHAGTIPLVGHFFSFLKTTPGYIICILIPFLLLIGGQGVNTIRLFRQYKREQMADMEAERQEIAKEREESARMMRELQELKEQLAKQSKQAQDTTSEPDEKSDEEK